MHYRCVQVYMFSNALPALGLFLLIFLYFPSAPQVDNDDDVNNDNDDNDYDPAATAQPQQPADQVGGIFCWYLSYSRIQDAYFRFLHICKIFPPCPGWTPAPVSDAWRVGE